MTAKDSKNRTIVLPITKSIYEKFMTDNKFAYEIIKELNTNHSELFPKEMSFGYKLNGKTRVSKK